MRTKAQVARIVIEGDRAAAVEYDIGGAMEMARARFSVILSAGAIGSPQLLQLSGIGPGALLAAHGIKVAADLPAVGGYLQDHLAISYRYKSREPTLNDELASWLGRMRAGLRYVLGRTGPLSLSVNQCGGFVRSRPDAPFPDLQLYFNPLTYTTATDDKRRGGVNPDPFSGFLLSYQPARPVSRGRVNIASANWRHAPHIQPNSLSAPKDIEDVVAGGRLLRALVRTKAMQALIAGPLGPAIEEMDDDALLADFRARSSTVFHPVGACRIGESPHDSVVDPSLKVHGLAGLRVADASVFPSITSGNTNAPTIMVGYKAAEIILRDVMNGR